MNPPLATMATVVLADSAAAVTDAELVQRVRRGDAWAGEALYRRHVGHLTAMAARLLGDRSEAEDVVQDTFITVLDEMASLRDPDALRSWMTQIAVHQVHRRFRRRRLRRLLGLDSGGGDPALDRLAAEGASAETCAELSALGRVLGRVAAKNRVAWMLRHVEGLALDEVARACDCSLATAKRRVAAADTRVRAHVRIAEEIDG